MRQGSVKTSIAYLLLALFLTVKMAGLHLLIHDGDGDHKAAHCDVCDFALANEHIPIVPSEVLNPVFSNTSLLLYAKKTVGDVVLFCDKVSADCLFSRPPPMA